MSVREKVLIVEDQFVEANNLQMILEKGGYDVCTIARSVMVALEIIKEEHPTFALVDIFLQGNLTGIDLGKILKEMGIPFLFLSGDSSKEVLDAAKATGPYGFLIKPFRKKDIIVAIEIARYHHIARVGSTNTPKYGPSRVKSSIGQDTMYNLPGIVGTSKGLIDVVNNLLVVAGTDTSVLVVGESGTGKERISECIHEHSSRRNLGLIKVNCAALPANLVESELFGHEKGAFSGAVERRIGKFEKADAGTIILDEVGELPLDVQVKLLRVLQEKEFERVGSNAIIKVRARIIAVTNRNLLNEVSAGRFRMDLYYRLNVFPLHVPPLRERKEDIPLLVNHFVRKLSTKFDKPNITVSEVVIKKLMDYDWPGNIRQLENLIESSVLKIRGEVIEEIDIPGAPIVPKVKTIAEVERDYILEVLKLCNGNIHGPEGAAALLGITEDDLTAKLRVIGSH